MPRVGAGPPVSQRELWLRRSAAIWKQLPDADRMRFVEVLAEVLVAVARTWSRRPVSGGKPT